MTLGQYIELLKELIEARPEARDFEVVFASDDEGNSFQAVSNSPSIGWCSDEYFKEFKGVKQLEGDLEDYGVADHPNCVCIN